MRVSEMTDEQFQDRCRAELEPGGSVCEDIKAMEAVGIGELLALLTKERVWRKDINVRLEALEKQLGHRL